MNIETVVRLFSTGVLMTVLGYIIYGAIAQATGEVSYYHEAIEALKDFRILAATIAAYGVLYVSTDALLFRPLLYRVRASARAAGARYPAPRGLSAPVPLADSGACRRERERRALQGGLAPRRRTCQRGAPPPE